MHGGCLSEWSHKWWIPDEDALYLSDGLACHVRTEQGMLYNQLEPLTSVADRTAWQLVADTQSAAQSQDFARVKTLLNAVDQWPNDVWVLRWASLGVQMDQRTGSGALVLETRAGDRTGCRWLSCVGEGCP